MIIILNMLVSIISYNHQPTGVLNTARLVQTVNGTIEGLVLVHLHEISTANMKTGHSKKTYKKWIPVCKQACSVRCRTSLAGQNLDKSSWLIEQFVANPKSCDFKNWRRWHTHDCADQWKHLRIQSKKKKLLWKGLCPRATPGQKNDENEAKQPPDHGGHLAVQVAVTCYQSTVLPTPRTAKFNGLRFFER